MERVWKKSNVVPFYVEFIIILIYSLMAMTLNARSNLIALYIRMENFACVGSSP